MDKTKVWNLAFMIVSGMQMEKDRVGDGFFWNKNLVKGYLQVF